MNPATLYTLNQLKSLNVAKSKDDGDEDEGVYCEGDGGDSWWLWCG